MRTLREIKRLLKEHGVQDTLLSLGFTLAPGGTWLYRRRRDLIDILWIQRTAEGRSFRLHAYVECEALMPDYDFDHFPEEFSKRLGNAFYTYVSPNGVDRDHYSWKIRDEEEASQSMKCLTKALCGPANEWFLGIESPLAVLENIALPVMEGDHGPFIRQALEKAHNKAMHATSA